MLQKVEVKRGLSKVFTGIWMGLVALLTVLTITIPAGDAFSATTLSWNAPITNTDGSTISDTDLVGYRVYYSTVSASDATFKGYTLLKDIGNVLTCDGSTKSDGSTLPDGTYYYVVSVYNTANNESAYSNEVTKTVSTQVASYTITGSAGTGGSISPSGATTVTSGGSQIYSITPSTGYTIASVQVDGVSVGAVSSYTFSSVTANHSIAATFSVIQTVTYTITGSAGTGGSISPSGATTVTSGGSQTYSITPSTGYKIASVLVDGVSVGAVSSYAFSNVTANHTISATFSAVTYTITGSAGTGGSITPTGSTTVISGNSQTYSITPSTGYKIASVQVDGVSAGAVSVYTFSNVTANHTISVTFSAVTYTITGSAGTGGSITPSGANTINYGGSQTYTISASTGYDIADVLVDGVSVGAVSSYIFSGVVANHTIAATFSEQTSGYTIRGSAGTGGSITPTGSTTVTSGGSKTYTIIPATGYDIAEVLIDGVSFGAVGSYTFNNVTANHTIAASFKTNSGENSTVLLMPISDTTINLDAVNYSTSAQLNTYTWPAGFAANAMLMKFDLSGIPEGAKIVSATLDLYLMESDANTSYTGYNLSLHRITNYNPDLSLATGYTYDGTNSWTANTNAYNNIPLAQADITAAYDTQAVNQTAGEKVWDATQLIKDWYAAPAINYGLMINSDPLAPSDTYRTFASSKNTTAAYIPFVVVVYSTSNAPESYTITGSAGTGGSISPSGSTTVTGGGSQTYTITPSSGYLISDVQVDGVSVGAVSSYTFSNVAANHTITAAFTAHAVTYTIKASAGRNGSISPSGTTSVNGGSSKTYTIKPAVRYKISGVTVDGVSVGAVSSYTFSNVKANHTVTATFKR